MAKKIPKKMTYLCLSVFLLGSTGCAARALGPEEALFKKPLIVGASVSGDTGTTSPGKRLGFKYSPTYDVKVIARGGAPGREIINAVSDQELSDRTIVVAVDFLFWDSVLPGAPAPSIDALQVLIDRTAKRGIPLVLGNVPGLLSDAQQARSALNRAVSARCRRDKGCFVLDLNGLHRQIVDDGFLQIEGKRYNLRQIVPDGLHLSAKASEHIADRIMDVLKRKAQNSNRTG